MKKTSYFPSALFCLSLFCLSCKADGTANDQSHKVEKLKKEIIGEWTFRQASARTNGQITTLEFLDNRRFVIEKGDSAISDSYKVTNARTISLNNLGEVRDFEANGEQAGFVLSTNEGDITVDADKTKELQKENRTKLICRRWRLLPIEGGKDSLVYVYKSYVTFSESGTYLDESYSTKEVSQPSTMKYKWKWDPKIENRIQYWYRGDNPKFESDYIKIRELTEKSLKITFATSLGSLDLSYVPEDN
ncbi:hypothetical protein GCM10023091_06240 [Ravibacter arvi]|uniref:Lipocalin-like domain-containing protein n=1 Tax=Ravibacter arvi TaxID=2051041 RepID=A0ABP8LRM1_9BACT